MGKITLYWQLGAVWSNKRALEVLSWRLVCSMPLISVTEGMLEMTPIFIRTTRKVKTKTKMCDITGFAQIPCCDEGILSKPRHL